MDRRFVEILRQYNADREDERLELMAIANGLRIGISPVDLVLDFGLPYDNDLIIEDIAVEKPQDIYYFQGYEIPTGEKHPKYGYNLSDRYKIEEDGVYTNEGGESEEQIQDEDIINEVMKLRRRDRLIVEARNKVVENFTDDPILRSAIRMHMNYTDGYIQPKFEEFKGTMVPFYRIGRNSSHYFYAGYKNGQRYQMAYDGYDDTRDVFRKVRAYDGYYGHL